MMLVMLPFLIAQIGLYFAIQWLVQNGHINSGFKRFLAIFAVGAISAVLNVGPIGLILGLPSIVVSSVIVAAMFRPKEIPCDSSSIIRTSSSTFSQT